MWLKRIVVSLGGISGRISGIIHGVGFGVLALMMFLTAFDVILRYVFNRPITGSFELTEYMMAIVVAFSLGYCYFVKGHVTVDFVVNRLSERKQNIIDVITGLLGFCIFAVITWQSALQVKIQFDSRVTSAVLLIPVYPFVAIVAFGSAVLCLAILAGLVESLYKAVSR